MAAARGRMHGAGVRCHVDEAGSCARIKTVCFKFGDVQAIHAGERQCVGEGGGEDVEGVLPLQLSGLS